MLARRELSLLLLVFQNASVSLLTRLSRTPASGIMYNPSSAVFLAEILKFTISLLMISLETSNKLIKKERIGWVRFRMAKRAMVELVEQRNEVIKLAVPAALYAMQNTLLYTALSNLPAATYQTTYQLKLLTTALFSILFFKRRLSFMKWVSLFLLTFGVAIVQLEGIWDFSSPSAIKVEVNEIGDARIGLLAILAACVSSGLAGGWFEYVLKTPTPPIKESLSPIPLETTKSSQLEDSSSTIRKRNISSTTASIPPSSPAISTKPRLELRPDSPSLWARNLQLSIPSLFFSFIGLILSYSTELSIFTSIFELFWNGTITEGFTPLVWVVVLNQALGGLLVAMVIRETDGVAKGFATSVAIIVSTTVSSISMRTIPGPPFLIGAALVILSTILYAYE